MHDVVERLLRLVVPAHPTSLPISNSSTGSRLGKTTVKEPQGSGRTTSLHTRAHTTGMAHRHQQRRRVVLRPADPHRRNAADRAPPRLRCARVGSPNAATSRARSPSWRTAAPPPSPRPLTGCPMTLGSGPNSRTGRPAPPAPTHRVWLHHRRAESENSGKNTGPKSVETTQTTRRLWQY